MLLIDFSNFVHVCWWPAVAAQEARARHMMKCTQCTSASVGVGTYCEKMPAEYQAREVVLTNIAHKMNTIKKAMEEAAFDEYDIVFVEDEHAAHKYALLPQYKADRQRRDFDPRPLAKEYCSTMLGVRWARSPGNEADDAIASIVKTRQQRDPTSITVIASSDKDLWQLYYPPHVFVYGLTTDKFLNATKIMESFGVPYPNLIPLVKALWGDPSDNVPNVVPRMQKQLLPLLKMEGTTLDNLVPLAKAWGTTKRCQELLNANIELAKINYKIVKLDPDCEVVWS